VPAFAACLPVRAVRYAGFWIRALAFLIDLVLQCILFLGLATVMGMMSNAMNTDTGADRKAASVALGFVIIALIFASALFYNVYPPSGRRRRASGFAASTSSARTAAGSAVRWRWGGVLPISFRCFRWDWASS